MKTGAARDHYSTVAVILHWLIAGLIAIGSTIGGFLGASVGRRLPPLALRIVIVVVGAVAIAMFLFN